MCRRGGARLCPIRLLTSKLPVWQYVTSSPFYPFFWQCYTLPNTSIHKTQLLTWVIHNTNVYEHISKPVWDIFENLPKTNMQIMWLKVVIINHQCVTHDLSSYQTLSCNGFGYIDVQLRSTEIVGNLQWWQKKESKTSSFVFFNKGTLYLY